MWRCSSNRGNVVPMTFAACQCIPRDMCAESPRSATADVPVQGLSLSYVEKLDSVACMLSTCGDGRNIVSHEVC